MSIGVPSYEHPKLQASALRGNLKRVVETIKVIRESIDAAKADTKRDTTSVVKQLEVNLAHITKWGKNLQEKIRLLEGNR